MRSSGRLRLLIGGIVAALVAAGLVAAVIASAVMPGAHPLRSPRRASPTTTRPPPSAPSTTAPAAPSRPASSVPHVMVIVLENHGYAQILGNPTAPYLNSLARRYGLATAAYATTHPSLPNYLALVSGSTQGVVDDCTTCTADAPQLVDQLQHARISWAAYMEAAPSACFTGFAPLFDRHHDPFVYAHHIVGDPAECRRVVPFTAFGAALAHGTLPSFVWVTPDVTHDMHTGTVAQGDAWLHAMLPAVLASRWYRRDGAVIVTFDESTGATDAGCCTGAAGGHVMTLVVSPRTSRGARLSTPVDGAGILRTIESLYGLPFLGGAADPRSGTLLPLLGRAPAHNG